MRVRLRLRVGWGCGGCGRGCGCGGCGCLQRPRHDPARPGTARRQRQARSADGVRRPEASIQPGPAPASVPSALDEKKRRRRDQPGTKRILTMRTGVAGGAVLRSRRAGRGGAGPAIVGGICLRLSAPYLAPLARDAGVEAADADPITMCRVRLVVRPVRNGLKRTSSRTAKRRGDPEEKPVVAGRLLLLARTACLVCFNALTRC